MKPKIIINNNKHLKKLIKQEVSMHGNNCDLNHLDVSNVINMNSIFYNTQFNGDISKWDVSNVTDMTHMFSSSKFNRDISSWDVSNVNDMNSMFYDSQFNADISKWDVSNVTNMNNMFFISKFNKNLDDWEPYKLQDKENMFADYTAPLPYWYTHENTQRAIVLYKLKKKLDNDLHDKNITKIKIKIKI